MWNIYWYITTDSKPLTKIYVSTSWYYSKSTDGIAIKSGLYFYIQYIRSCLFLYHASSYNYLYLFFIYVYGKLPYNLSGISCFVIIPKMWSNFSLFIIMINLFIWKYKIVLDSLIISNIFDRIGDKCFNFLKILTVWIYD